LGTLCLGLWCHCTGGCALVFPCAARGGDGFSVRACCPPLRTVCGQLPTGARAACDRVVTVMREVHRVLVSLDGPHDNVVKIKPPLVFSVADADELVAALAATLGVCFPAPVAPRL
jgi:hypothetical protein